MVIKTSTVAYRMFLFGMGMGLTMACALPDLAHATSYYVSTGGDNSDSGLSDTEAWLTIAHAATQAQAGDTVHIEGGDYGHEHVVISNSGTSGNPITFQGYGGAVVLNGEDEIGYGIYIDAEEYISISGFEISEYQFGILGMSSSHISITDCVAYLNYKGVSFQGNGGHDNTIGSIEAYNNDMCNIELSACTNSLIENCWSYSKEGLANCADYAYALINGSTNNAIRNCIAGQREVDGGNSMGHGFAFRHDSSYNQVIDCKSYYTACEHYKVSEDSDYNEFINCSGEGEDNAYYTAGFHVKSSYNTIKNCTFEGMDQGILVMYSTAEPSATPIQGNVIQNCVTVDNGVGLFIIDYGEDYPPENNTIENCISISNSTGLRIDSPNNSNNYNNVWGNATDYAGCSAGNGGISTEPLFADEGNGDFHLKSEFGRWDGAKAQWIYDNVTSPCIDAGNPSDAYDVELDYPAGQLNMGAYGNTVEASLGTAVPIGTIIGTVTNEDAMGLDEATVTDGTRITTTNASGEYELGDVSAGIYTVTASKEGHIPQAQENIEVLEGVATTVDFQLAVGPDLVGYWRFEDGTGTTAVDSSDYGNDGEIHGAQWTTQGKYGSALVFDGTDSYVDCGNDKSLNLVYEISVLLWLNTAAFGEGGHNVSPISKAESGVDSSWQLRYNAPGGGDYMGFQFVGDPEGSTWASVMQPLSVETWYHIAGTFDGTTIRCYLDGDETDTNYISAITGGDSRLFIGQDGWGNVFSGSIDEVKIYNRALTAEEVKDDYLGIGDDDDDDDDDLECPSGYLDCNGLISDGCEVNINTDEENCGQCGNQCEQGQECKQGECLGDIESGCECGTTGTKASLGSGSLLPICLWILLIRLRKNR